MTTLSCTANYGQEGLGRHFAQLIEMVRQNGDLDAYYCPSPKSGDTRGQKVRLRIVHPMVAYTPIRFNPGWRWYIGAELFDRAVARRIQPTGRHIGFSGQSLHTFRTLRADVLELVSPTAHVDLLANRFQLAFKTHPVERPFFNEIGRRKAVAEYELADLIHVASAYARQSFLDIGFAPEKLLRINLELPKRFTPRSERHDGDTFRIIYLGSLTVTKGVPVLLEAFRGLIGNAELVLFGGWGTRGMRKFIQGCMAADSRIRVTSGDPLDELRSADILVHPSFSDGFGYAPMEALACGVPVIVTEDTGMKEYVREGVNGWIVPTGDVDALLERLEHVRRYPLLGEGKAAVREQR